MRCSPVVRKLSADPWKTHAGDTSELMAKVRKALVVNPDSTSGNPLVRTFRQPEPASREEKFTVPASRASDVAQNPYHQRDFRRQYPKTEFVSQSELATLLVAQGGFTSLPAVASSSASTTAVTADTPAPSLSSLYSSPTAVAAPAFKPPTPPGLKFSWAPSKDVIPSDPNIDFPMVNYSAFAKSA
ncbi:hypothetical protein BCR35DRAFT_277434 [Leucosporidium creatinivorum]|uniref:Uncharacterized protein n=1 Tax=Leucosporidium creatinivorum TaxID=106004 RepID=A0A1Y2FU32_9BASI|nr:hypothetical protein BCR35DRAFT_277434 [Leucosporidium creatinivorum]